MKRGPLTIVVILGIGVVVWLGRNWIAMGAEQVAHSTEGASPRTAPGGSIAGIREKLQVTRAWAEQGNAGGTSNEGLPPSVAVNVANLPKMRVPLIVPGSSVIMPDVAHALQLSTGELKEIETAIAAHRDQHLERLDSSVVIAELPDGFVLSYAMEDAWMDAVSEAIKRDIFDAVDSSSRALLEAVEIGYLSEALLPYPLMSGTVEIVRLKGGKIQTRLKTKGRAGSATRVTEGQGVFFLREFYGQRAMKELEKRGLLPEMRGTGGTSGGPKRVND